MLERRDLLAGDFNYDTGNELRIYRLAVATTAEYTTAIGGPAAALASVQQLVQDLNAIYRPELAIEFDLVSGLNTIFTDAVTDGFSNGSLSNMINEATSVIDVAMGSSSSKNSLLNEVTYDVGHVLGTFGGGGTSGLAYLGIVGDFNDYFSNDTGLRAGGGTVVGNISSVGTDGWTLVVAHALGHQFDAGHTFNASVAGTNCNANAINPLSAYELASGSTIMSYAGICGANNLQSNEDPVFHSASFEDINTFIADSDSIPWYDANSNTTTTLTNTKPVVDAGTTYTIPAQTPFSLTAVGTNGDSDPLTYSWEQLDLGAPQSLPISDLGSGPIFRAFAPIDDPTRIFPRLEDQLAGVDTAALGEVLPTTTRDLNFRIR